MMEYVDVEERKRALAALIGVEKALWIAVDGFPRVHPIANEDLDREPRTRPPPSISCALN